MLDMPSHQSPAVELRPVKGHEAAAGDNGKPDCGKLSVLNIEIYGSAWVQFFVCVAGVFACGVTHDFVQEYVFRYDAFDFGWFMTLWSAPLSVTCAHVHARSACNVRLGACSAECGRLACFYPDDAEEEIRCRELLIFVVAAWLQLRQDNRGHEISSIKWSEYVNLTIVSAVCMHSCNPLHTRARTHAHRVRHRKHSIFQPQDPWPCGRVHAMHAA
jgi:hypothetical protein|eukprot:Tamp_10250.p2 GENE.Tamp_10250~~Tamp_10250.p2  ORF type:complete len:216 (-),score=30.23 Tamp_10250:1113-1760(-)